MACSCCGESKKPDNVFKPYQRRSCTDVLFLLGFVALWIAMFSILGTSIENGDPDKLIRGVNYKGEICGVTDAVKNQKYAAWPSLVDYDFKVCVDDCAKTGLTGNGMVATYQSELFLYYCIPKTQGGVSISISGFDDTAETFTRAIGDLYTSWPVILASPFFALIFAILYMVASRIFAKCLIVLLLCLVGLSGSLCSLALLYYGYEARQDGNESTDDRSDAMLGLGFLVAILTLAFICVCVCMRKQIAIAIEIIRETSAAVSDMKCMLFFPLFSVVGGMLYFLYWIAVSLYIFSNTKTTTPAFPTAITASSEYASYYNSATTYTEYEWDEALQNTFALHFFHLLWNVQFLIYFNYLVIAGAIGNWYFSDRDADNKQVRGDGDSQLPESPVKASCCRTFRFHLGSVALGSLIIAIVQFMRAVAKYIEETTKAENPSQCQKVMWKFVHCCLWCLECCLDKISKNAYVWQAIYGDSFFTSACSATSLVLSNLGRSAAMNAVGTFVLFLGKLICAMLTAAIGGLAIESIYDNEVSTTATPMFIMFVLGYMVSALLINVFDTSINAMFLCFLIDEDHVKNGGKMYASPALQKIVGHVSTQFAEEADRATKLRNLKMVDGQVVQGTQYDAKADLA